MTTKSQSRSDRRREQILDAAEPLFLKAGLRGTSMESIARAAQIAKPTLYAYFPDKESVFRAGILRVVDRLRARTDAALATPAPITDRIIAGLGAKFAALFQLLSTTDQVQELMADKSRFAGAEFAALDDWLLNRITQLLTDAGHPDPRARAQLLIACADGIKLRAASEADLMCQITFVTRRLIDP